MVRDRRSMKLMKICATTNLDGGGESVRFALG
jgi:hypothetical protein